MQASDGRETTGRGTPVLVINPASDIAFADACRAAIEAGSSRPERLEAVLRATWPRAVVRPRELSGETLVVWYVYRDGHWVSSA